VFEAVDIYSGERRWIRFMWLHPTEPGLTLRELFIAKRLFPAGKEDFSEVLEGVRSPSAKSPLKSPLPSSPGKTTMGSTNSNTTLQLALNSSSPTVVEKPILPAEPMRPSCLPVLDEFQVFQDLVVGVYEAPARGAHTLSREINGFSNLEDSGHDGESGLSQFRFNQLTSGLLHSVQELQKRGLFLLDLRAEAIWISSLDNVPRDERLHQQECLTGVRNSLRLIRSKLDAACNKEGNYSVVLEQDSHMITTILGGDMREGFTAMSRQHQLAQESLASVPRREECVVSFLELENLCFSKLQRDRSMSLLKGIPLHYLSGAETGGVNYYKENMSYFESYGEPISALTLTSQSFQTTQTGGDDDVAREAFYRESLINSLPPFLQLYKLSDTLEKSTYNNVFLWRLRELGMSQHPALVAWLIGRHLESRGKPVTLKGEFEGTFSDGFSIPEGVSAAGDSLLESAVGQTEGGDNGSSAAATKASTQPQTIPQHRKNPYLVPTSLTDDLLQQSQSFCLMRLFVIMLRALPSSISEADVSERRSQEGYLSRKKSNALECGVTVNWESDILGSAPGPLQDTRAAADLGTGVYTGYYENSVKSPEKKSSSIAYLFNAVECNGAYFYGAGFDSEEITDGDELKDYAGLTKMGNYTKEVKSLKGIKPTQDIILACGMPESNHNLLSRTETLRPEEVEGGYSQTQESFGTLGVLSEYAQWEGVDQSQYYEDPNQETLPPISSPVIPPWDPSHEMTQLVGGETGDSSPKTKKKKGIQRSTPTFNKGICESAVFCKFSRAWHSWVTASLPFEGAKFESICSACEEVLNASKGIYWDPRVQVYVDSNALNEGGFHASDNIVADPLSTPIAVKNSSGEKGENKPGDGDKEKDGVNINAVVSAKKTASALAEKDSPRAAGRGGDKEHNERDPHRPAQQLFKAYFDKHSSFGIMEKVILWLLGVNEVYTSEKIFLDALFSDLSLSSGGVLSAVAGKNKGKIRTSENGGFMHESVLLPSHWSNFAHASLFGHADSSGFINDTPPSASVYTSRYPNVFNVCAMLFEERVDSGLVPANFYRIPTSENTGTDKGQRLIWDCVSAEGFYPTPKPPESPENSPKDGDATTPKEKKKKDKSPQKSPRTQISRMNVDSTIVDVPGLSCAHLWRLLQVLPILEHGARIRIRHLDLTGTEGLLETPASRRKRLIGFGESSAVQSSQFGAKNSVGMMYGESSLNSCTHFNGRLEIAALIKYFKQNSSAHRILLIKKRAKIGSEKVVDYNGLTIQQKAKKVPVFEDLASGKEEEEPPQLVHPPKGMEAIVLPRAAKTVVDLSDGLRSGTCRLYLNLCEELHFTGKVVGGGGGPAIRQLVLDWPSKVEGIDVTAKLSRDQMIQLRTRDSTNSAPDSPQKGNSDPQAVPEDSNALPQGKPLSFNPIHPALPKLRCLSMRNLKMFSAGGRLVLDALSRDSCALEFLDLSHCGLDDSFLEQLREQSMLFSGGKCLGTPTQSATPTLLGRYLRCLLLSNNCFSGQGVGYLAIELGSARALECLDLSGNCCPGVGKAMKTLFTSENSAAKTLRLLDLSSNSLLTEDATNLAEVVRASAAVVNIDQTTGKEDSENPNFLTLNISNNSIGRLGLVKFLELCCVGLENPPPCRININKAIAGESQEDYPFQKSLCDLLTVMRNKGVLGSSPPPGSSTELASVVELPLEVYKASFIITEPSTKLPYWRPATLVGGEPKSPPLSPRAAKQAAIANKGKRTEVGWMRMELYHSGASCGLHSLADEMAWVDYERMVAAKLAAEEEARLLAREEAEEVPSAPPVQTPKVISGPVAVSLN